MATPSGRSPAPASPRSPTSAGGAGAAAPPPGPRRALTALLRSLDRWRVEHVCGQEPSPATPPRPRAPHRRGQPAREAGLPGAGQGLAWNSGWRDQHPRGCQSLSPARGSPLESGGSWECGGGNCAWMSGWGDRIPLGSRCRVSIRLSERGEKLEIVAPAAQMS